MCRMHVVHCIYSLKSAKLRYLLHTMYFSVYTTATVDSVLLYFLHMCLS